MMWTYRIFKLGILSPHVYIESRQYRHRYIQRVRKIAALKTLLLFALLIIVVSNSLPEYTNTLSFSALSLLMLNFYCESDGVSKAYSGSKLKRKFINFKSWMKRVLFKKLILTSLFCVVVYFFQEIALYIVAGFGLCLAIGKVKTGDRFMKNIVEEHIYREEYSINKLIFYPLVVALLIPFFEVDFSNISLLNIFNCNLFASVITSLE